MKTAVLLAGLLAGHLGATGLSNPSFTGPATVTGGQSATLVFSVANSNGVNAITDVRPVFGVSPNGYAPSVSGPSPASYATLAAGASASFTWVFSGYGCGSADFTASAEGMDSGVTVTSSVTTYQASLYCTPTPTPTVSPTLTATPNWTATPTPWIIVVDHVEPTAFIHGNLFRPLLGQPLQLEAVLPEASQLSVELFDRLGHKVKSFSLDAAAGPVSLAWDGRSEDGLLVSSGIYVAQFRARNLDRRVKFAVIK
jgi:hypothetical protein